MAANGTCMHMWYDVRACISKFHTRRRSSRRRKAKEALEHARPQLKGNGTITEERWDGSTFHFAADLQGKTVTGTLAVTDTDFVIDAKLPLMWRLFEGRIEKMILEQVKQMM